MSKIIITDGPNNKKTDRIVRNGFNDVYVDLDGICEDIRADLKESDSPCMNCYTILDALEHILFYMTVPLVETKLENENGNRQAYLDEPYPGNDEDEDENESENSSADEDETNEKLVDGDEVLCMLSDDEDHPRFSVSGTISANLAAEILKEIKQRENAEDGEILCALSFPLGIVDEPKED